MEEEIMKYAGLTLEEKNGEFYFQNRALATTHHGKYADMEKRSRFMRNYELEEKRTAYTAIRHVIKKSRKEIRQILKVPHVYVYSTSLHEETKLYPGALRWFDHTEMFRHKPSRSYLITTQPYGLTIDKYNALEKLCEKLEIGWSISYFDAWHYPGNTPLVVMANMEFIELFNERRINT